MRSINYFNTLITVAADCPAKAAEIPAKAGSIADWQYRLLMAAPRTSDDLLVDVTAARRDVPEDERADLWQEVFSRSQACMRTSPLVKRHGWALWHDSDGLVYPVDPATERYADLQADPLVAKVAGMRNKRA